MTKSKNCFVACLMTLCLFGCNTVETTEKSEYYVADFEEINTETVSVSPSELELIFYNESENTVGLGSWYVLETTKDDEWYGCKEVPSEYIRVWTDELYVVESGNTISRKYNWETYYGRLASGDYRILFEVHILDKNLQILDTKIIETRFCIG